MVTNFRRRNAVCKLCGAPNEGHKYCKRCGIAVGAGHIETQLKYGTCKDCNNKLGRKLKW